MQMIRIDDASRGMHRPRAVRRACAALGGTIGFALSGCASSVSEEPARLPDPPPASRSPEVSAAMRSLLDDSTELRRTLLQPTLPDTAGVARMAQTLADMERTTRELERSGGATRHPLLDANLGAFRQEIRFAREALRRDPPDFLQVAIVPGACVYCHTSIPREVGAGSVSLRFGVTAP